MYYIRTVSGSYWRDREGVMWVHRDMGSRSGFYADPDLPWDSYYSSEDYEFTLEEACDAIKGFDNPNDWMIVTKKAPDEVVMLGALLRKSKSEYYGLPK